MFFGNERAALLEFLRNLTPQVLLLTCAFFLGSQLDWSTVRLTTGGLGLTFAFWMCGVLWLAAFMANLTRFLESAVSSTEELDIAAERIRRSDGGTMSKLRSVLIAAWRHNKRGLFQAAVVVLFAYASILPVILMAVHGASSLLKVAK